MMKPGDFAVEYNTVIQGQSITDAEVQSRQTQLQLSVYYSPIQFVRAGLGLGGSRFEVSPYNDRSFDGGYGVSPSAGVDVYSPALLKPRFRAVAGLQAAYLNSGDDYDYSYSGPVLDPSVGVTAQVGPYVNLEGGARWHVLYGTMVDDGDNAHAFSNNEYMRFYFAVTAVSPVGVYAQASLDASESAGRDHFKNGLDDAAFGIRLGVLIARDSAQRKMTETNRQYFPEASELREKQKDMTEELE
jgi:hypothetical protein